MANSQMTDERNRFYFDFDLHDADIREFIDLAIAFLKDQLHCLVPESLRDNIGTVLARLVQQHTDADCVFVRRRNSDGTLELIGEPSKFDAFAGLPPRIKQRGEGVSGWVLENTNGEPFVCRDVHDPSLPDAIRAAHTQGLNSNWTEDERQFLESISAEACVPLLIGDEPVAVIVAVHSEAYSEQEQQKIEAVLRGWQKPLTLLHWLSCICAEFDEHQFRIDHVLDALAELARIDDHNLLLRKMMTILTSGKGLAWHRAMIFFFEQEFPADATCAIGVGGTGEPLWWERQRHIADSFLSLQDSMFACELDNYAEDDSLYHMTTRDPEHPWRIPENVLANHSGIEGLFTRDINNHEFLKSGSLYLTPDDPFIRGISQGDFASAFKDNASRCGHWMFPLIVSRKKSASPEISYQSIGFLLLDNPYRMYPEIASKLPLTRLICNIIASILFHHMHDSPNRPERKSCPPAEEFAKALRKAGLDNARVSELTTHYRVAHDQLALHVPQSSTLPQSTEVQEVLDRLKEKIWN